MMKRRKKKRRRRKMMMLNLIQSFMTSSMSKAIRNLMFKKWLNKGSLLINKSRLLLTRKVVMRMMMKKSLN